MSWFAVVYAELEMDPAAEARWRGLDVDPASFDDWPEDFVLPDEPVGVAATIDAVSALDAPPGFVRVERKDGKVTIRGVLHEEDYETHHGALATALRGAAEVGCIGDAYLAEAQLADFAWHISFTKKGSRLKSLPERRRAALLPAITKAVEVPGITPAAAAAASAPQDLALPPPAAVSRSIEELDRAFEADWFGLSAPEMDVLLHHHWRIAQEDSDAGKRKAARKRANMLACNAFGFETGMEFDYEDVAGTRLCDRAIEVARATKESPAFVTKIERVRDKPLSPAAKKKRTAGQRVKAAIAAFDAGSASDEDAACLLDGLLAIEQRGFRGRDQMRGHLERAVVRPDPRLARGARERLSDELVEQARTDSAAAFYGVSLAHVLGANGDLAHLRHVFDRVSADSRIGNATAEMLLAGAPPALFAEVFGTSFPKYRRENKSPKEWHEGLLDSSLEKKMAQLLAAWEP